MEHPNLILVHTYGTRPEVELAKTTLDNAGIPAMIQADTIGGMRDHVAWTGEGFRIFVREEDAAAARAVLTPPADGGLPDESDLTAG